MEGTFVIFDQCDPEQKNNYIFVRLDAINYTKHPQQVLCSDVFVNH